MEVVLLRQYLLGSGEGTVGLKSVTMCRSRIDMYFICAKEEKEEGGREESGGYGRKGRGKLEK